MSPFLRLFSIAQFCYKTLSLASVLMVFLALSPLAAHADGDYDVDNITVNADGKDTNDARKNALLQGKRDAFTAIITKQAPTKLNELLQKTPVSRIDSLINGFEPSQEDSTPTHYRAVIRYHFNGDAVQKLIQELTAGDKKPVSTITTPAPDNVVIPLSSNGQPRKAVLVLPVYNDGNTLSLWQDENKWRQVWYEAALESGNGLVVAPLGDFDDRVDIDSTNIMEASVGSLSRMYGRYGVGEIDILTSFYNLKADPKPTLEVTIIRLAPGIKELSHSNYTIHSTETLDTLLVRAANDIAQNIYKQQTIDKNKIESERVKEITASFKSSDINQWQVVRKHLLERKNIVGVRFNSISFYETTLTISYKGSADLLGKTLVASGLRVLQDGDKLVLELK